jgi:16S rRNA pseudouridine516 synthase
VDKVYYAKVSGVVTQEDQDLFLQGVDIQDKDLTLPATLKVITSGEISEVELTLHEGRFHQVKRMFEAVGKEVIYLKRLSMGSLKLDESLEPGEYRELTEQELTLLK